MTSSLAQRLLDALADGGARTALVDVDGQELSFTELSHRVTDFSGLLQGWGVCAGDRVLLLLPKSADLIIAQIACLLLQVVAVPLAPDSPERIVADVISDCEPVLQVHPQGAGLLAPLAEGRVREDRLIGFEVASVLYTSGSTGRPRGVMVRASSILNLAEWGITRFSVSTKDVFAVAAPLHFAASIFDVYTALLARASMVLLPEVALLAPGSLADTVLRHRVSIWSSVPSVLMAMVAGSAFSGDLRAWGSLRVIIVNGEHVLVDSIRRLVLPPGASVYQFYGTTETNVCACYEVPREIPKSVRRLPVGTACAGHRITVEDKDAEGIGEIRVDGPGVMYGYWGEAFRADPGSHHTRDLGQFDADGLLTLHGRLDLVTKVRGRRVDLNAVEAVLLEHQGVEAAAAFTRGDGMTNQLVVVVEIRGETTVLDVFRHCRENLAPHSRPDVVTAGAVPRTRRGKIDRIALAESFDPRSAK